MSTHNLFTTIASDDLGTTRGAANFPGFQGCGPGYFSKGCVDGGMNLDEFLAISQHSKMVNGKTATFGNWADWMRHNNYPSKALDSIGGPRKR